MKTKHAWCIVTKKGNPVCFNAQMPIFPNKKVAKQEMEYYGGPISGWRIIRVAINSVIK